MKKLLLLLLLCTVGVTNLVAQSFDEGILNYTVNADGTSITTNCNYWSSTHSDINNAYCVYFGNNYVGFSNSMNDRSTGNVVRLVNPVNN